MHPALHSWREELPATLVRLARLSRGNCGAFGSGPAQFNQSRQVTPAAPVERPKWIEIERPFPAFALAIPEAADVSFSHAIRRHAEGGGRKDILTLGEPDSPSPYLRVEIYRPGSEIRRFAHLDGQRHQQDRLEPNRRVDLQPGRLSQQRHEKHLADSLKGGDHADIRTRFRRRTDRASRGSGRATDRAEEGA